MEIKRILVSPDSFKGSLTADEAAIAIAEGLRDSGFKGIIDICPLSDGGEGFGNIISKYKGGNVRPVAIPAVDAVGKEITAGYLWDEQSLTAYIESASVIGLERISEEDRDPLKASSRGLGIMIKDALKRGVKDLYVSLGGSATSDGGMGMMTELGINFLDKNGRLLKGSGEDMDKITEIDIDSMEPKLQDVAFHAVCDVNNPLLGRHGAVYTFAGQKGAKEEDLPVLEGGMANLCRCMEENGISGKGDKDKPGTGAAGGIGFALQSVFGAAYINGIEFIKTLTGFREKLKAADLVLTGEGCVDIQSLMGKVLSGIIKETGLGKPVIAFGGKVKDRKRLLSSGLAEAIEISDQSLPDSENMRKPTALQNLKKASSQISLTMKN